MILPEHARPGTLVNCLALDVARPLYPRLDLDLPDLSADAVHQTLKQALEWGKLPRFHDQLWSCLTSYAEATLPEPARQQLLHWFWTSYNGYHAADPDISDWIEIILVASIGVNGRSDLPLPLQQSEVLNRFLDMFAQELDWDGLAQELDHLRELRPSAWDRKLLTRYEWVYFDRQSGSDPFLPIKFACQGQALRRTLRHMPPGSEPDFPLEELNNYARKTIDERGGWRPEGTQLCSLHEVT